MRRHIVVRRSMTDEVDRELLAEKMSNHVASQKVLKILPTDPSFCVYAVFIRL